MTDELFSVPEVLSPRLAWLRKHGIITHHYVVEGCDSTWFAGFQEWWPELKGVNFFAAETAHHGDSRCVERDNEQEALADLARYYELKLWNEEQP